MIYDLKNLFTSLGNKLFVVNKIKCKEDNTGIRDNIFNVIELITTKQLLLSFTSFCLLLSFHRLVC